MYPAHKQIRIAITTMDGELLDQFPVCHWRTETGDDLDDVENVGSAASRSGLIERIERYVSAPPAPPLRQIMAEEFMAEESTEESDGPTDADNDAVSILVTAMEAHGSRDLEINGSDLQTRLAQTTLLNAISWLELGHFTEARGLAHDPNAEA